MSAATPRIVVPRKRERLQPTSVLVVAVLGFAASAASAQLAGSAKVPLFAGDARSVVAKARTSSTLIPLTLDAGGALLVVRSSNPGATVTLLSPDGVEVNERNAREKGYHLLTVPPDANDDDVATPFFLAGPGEHTYIGVPESARAGQYKVKVDCSAISSDTAIAVLQLSTSGLSGARPPEGGATEPVRAGLATSSPIYMVGDTVVFTAPLFEGERPVRAPGTTVTARVADENDPSAPVTELTLEDGGRHDERPGDGLYTGAFVAKTAGRFVATMRAEGMSRAGDRFSRSAAIRFRVIEPTARLGSFRASAVDDDRNGFIDAIEVRAEVEVGRPGRYDLSMTLAASNGREASESAKATLGAGRQEIVVRFTPWSIERLEVDGPYALRNATLVFRGDPEPALADRRDDAGTTEGVRLESLDRGPISFTGTSRAYGVDRDGDGRYELLRAEVGVRIQVAGEYDWSGRAYDAAVKEIGSESRSATLGAGTHVLVLEFATGAAAARCAPAPFRLGALVVEGDEGWVSYDGQEIEFANISVDRLEGGAACPAPALTGPR